MGELEADTGEEAEELESELEGMGEEEETPETSSQEDEESEW